MKFRRLFTAFLLSSFVACNNPPDTTIEQKFGSNGDFIVTPSGTDTDPGDSVAGIYEEINGSASEVVSINVPKTIQTIKGENKGKFTAYDSHGAADPSPATYSFTPLTEEEAKAVIDGILAENPDTYFAFYKNASESPGNYTFSVDYLIKRKPDGKDAVIDYTGFIKDFPTTRSNMAALEAHGVFVLDPVRLPQKELEDRVRNFVKEGYNN